MKARVLAIIISILAIILCEGSFNNMSAQSPYDVDNTSGKYLDMSKPIMITMKFVESDSDESLCEYCRYDAQGRIIEYGCLVGQFDYETYVRMFKIHYSSKKIDSIQWKEVISGYVSEKMDLIFKKGISFYDQFTGDVPGYLRDTDTDVKDLDPYSIASMRTYAESKNDILERQFGRLYDFSTIKWDKEEKDEKLGLPIYSEFENDYGDEYESYILAYSYLPGDYSQKIVFHKKRAEFDGDIYENESKYIITEKYLNTDVDPRKGK
ncbi:MAG: hypothetical protein J6S84_07945 [Bacteroidales bacterium]|nr:hypothetical protein [Bacteroidales bacterium]